MTGLPWDASYQHDEPAPWDIGRPQQAVTRLVSEGAFSGNVLDAGCGTGEHSLLIASLGLPVLGVDVAETALAMAREKASNRGIKAEFSTADALHFDRLGRTFDSALDCGLFHSFNSDERAQYAASLASVIRRDGILYVLCFSDAVPDAVPHPVTQDELKAAFNPARGWHVVAIRPEKLETTFHEYGAPAWLATMKRT